MGQGENGLGCGGAEREKDEKKKRKKKKNEGQPHPGQNEDREGVAHQTGLPDGCADIVTAAQSLHWMEPTATLAEIARILRPGGLFAAYDYDWPPTLHWELDRLAQEVGSRLVELVRERGLAHS